MYSDIGYQILLFFVFFALGMVCAFVFDTFRVSERLCKSNKFLCAVKDIFFWIVITILMFAICLRFNNGEMRFFMFVGIVIGAFAYLNTISKFVLKILLYIITGVKKILYITVKIAFIPISLLIKLINKPFIVALSFSKKSIKKILEKFKFKIKVFKKFKR